MPLDFTIFLEYGLRIIPIWPGTYNPEEDITICQCPRKSYCPNAAKHPMYSQWYETPPPPNNETTISQIKNSKCNFAIVTGTLPNDPTKQLIIVDVDAPAMSLPEISKLPPTVTIATPNSGLHFYYIIPSTEVIHNLSTGYVDIRSHHGYALTSPSSRYRFVPSSLSTITELPELPLIPTRANTSRSKSLNPSTGINHPNDPYNSFTDVTEDGLVALGSRDQYVFHELITLCNAGHSLNSLLQQADTIHSQLEQPPKDPYTLSAIRDKVYYVYERYSDPETEALREAMDATYPPAK